MNRIKELENELAEARKDAAEAHKRRTRDFAAKFPIKYAYHVRVLEVKEAARRDCFSFPPSHIADEVTECIRITRTISNAEELKAAAAEFDCGVPFDTKDLSRDSVAYYRWRGQLHYGHGGTLFLALPAEVSDAEWEAMKTGDIPERLLKG